MSLTANRVLIVDDEPSLLKMMSLYLGRMGYSVVTAESTEKAWSEMEAGSGGFDVVVLDATMNGTPMEELAGRMLAADSNLRVIAASGYPVDITGLQAAAPGRVMFLHKPFSPPMLGNAVRRMIGAQETDL